MHWFRTWEVHGCSHARFLVNFPFQIGEERQEEKGGGDLAQWRRMYIYALHLPEYLVILGDNLIYLVE